MPTNEYLSTYYIIVIPFHYYLPYHYNWVSLYRRNNNYDMLFIDAAEMH